MNEPYFAMVFLSKTTLKNRMILKSALVFSGMPGSSKLIFVRTRVNRQNAITSGR